MMVIHWTRIFVAFCTLTLLALSAHGQNLTGTWRADVETANGTVPTVFEFVEEGGEVSGTFRNSFIPSPIPIHDGIVDGNEVAFKLALMSGILGYEGTFDGNELTLRAYVVEGEFPGDPSATLILTRQE